MSWQETGDTLQQMVFEYMFVGSGFSLLESAASSTKSFMKQSMSSALRNVEIGSVTEEMVHAIRTNLAHIETEIPGFIRTSSKRVKLGTPGDAIRNILQETWPEARIVAYEKNAANWVKAHKMTGVDKVTLDIQHVMATEIKTQIKSRNRIYERLTGLHGEDFLTKLERLGSITLENKIPLPEGAFQIDIRIWNGQIKEANTIFSAIWDHDVLTQKILYEAYNNLTRTPEKIKGGWKFWGKTKGGLEIEMLQENNKLKAYPKMLDT